jgi:hypothetical protein
MKLLLCLCGFVSDAPKQLSAGLSNLICHDGWAVRIRLRIIHLKLFFQQCTRNIGVTVTLWTRMWDGPGSISAWLLFTVSGNSGGIYGFHWSQRRHCLRPLIFWDCGFDSCQGRGYMSLVSVVCCQVEVCATGWSLVQRSPADWRVSGCDREASTTRRPWPTRGCRAMGKTFRDLCRHMMDWNLKVDHSSVPHNRYMLILYDYFPA